MNDAAKTPLAVKIEGLTRSFGDYRVLRGIDVQIEEGESVVIFGPNGAGKTTLIKVLATIMKPTSGKILVGGLELKDNEETVRRRLGVVTHQTYLYGNLTAFENLSFYCRMYDVPNSTERIEELVTLVGMVPHLHKRVETMSRGMQQRIAIARSLLHRPTIMLLDEAETGLDQESLGMLQTAVRTDPETRRTVIMTTHNLEHGLSLCDRIIILNKGKIAYQSARQVLDIDGLKQAYKYYTGVAL